MNYSAGPRRRRVSVVSTRVAASSSATPSFDPVVAKRFERPRRVPVVSVVSSHRSFEHISTIMPPRTTVVPRLVGRRSAPKVSVARVPVGPNPSTTPPPYKPLIKPVVPPRFPRARRLHPQPIVIATEPANLPIVPPPYLPFIKPVVPPRLVRRQSLYPQPAVVTGNARRSFVNLGEFKQTTLVVPRSPLRRGFPAIVLHSLCENRPLVLPAPDPIVVPRFVPRRRLPATITHTAKSIPNVFEPIVVPRFYRIPGVRQTHLAGNIPQAIRPSKPLILTPLAAQVINIVRRRRVNLPPVDASAAPVRNLESTPSIVVPRYIPKALSRQPFIRQAGGKVKLVTPREPFVSPRLVGSFWSRKGMFPTMKPIVMHTSLPIAMTPDPVGEGYWDIIAASIGWLRSDASIVSLFSDSYSTNVCKFASDITPRDTDPPYAVFYEPQEVESFETTDGGGASSLVEGVYRIDVFATTKLAARKLSETLADSLNDAPLWFANGTLIHLRRTQRQYPTLEVPGTGTNVVMFKRMIELEYKFERTYKIS